LKAELVGFYNEGVIRDGGKERSIVLSCPKHDDRSFLLAAFYLS